MKKNTGLMVLFSAPICVSCAVVKSERIAENEASPSGVVYYLPTRPIKFEFIRQATATKPEVDKANAAVIASKEQYEAAVAALEELEARLEALPENAGDLTIENINEAIDLAKANKKIEEAKFSAAKKKQAAALATHHMALDGQIPLSDSIVVTVLPAVADTRQRYAANLDHLASRSDKFAIKTTDAGLLSTSTGSSDDQSAQIIVALAQSLVASGVGGATRIGSSSTSILSSRTSSDGKGSADAIVNCGDGVTRKQSEPAKPFRFEYTFDPSSIGVNRRKITNLGIVESGNVNPWQYIESVLCGKGADYSFEWKALLANVSAMEPKSKKNNSKEFGGLFYRRTLPYRLEIYSGERKSISPLQGGNGVSEKLEWLSFYPIKALSFELPNESPPELLQISGGAFSAVDYDTEFSNGILISHKEDRPSEILKVVAIPYDIVKALISVPAEILSLKIDYSSKEASLIDAERKIIESRDALDESKVDSSEE